MTQIVFLAVLTTGMAWGCATSSSVSVGTASYPTTGTHRIVDQNHRLLQKTVWRKGKLVEAWQLEEPANASNIPGAYAQADRAASSNPRWIQSVRHGNGRITTYDQDGHDIGFTDYLDGDYWRGAH